LPSGDDTTVLALGCPTLEMGIGFESVKPYGRASCLGSTGIQLKELLVSLHSMLIIKVVRFLYAKAKFNTLSPNKTPLQYFAYSNMESST
jgi:hypothetical protein